MHLLQIEQQVFDLLKSHQVALLYVVPIQYKKQAIASQAKARPLLCCIKKPAKKAAIDTKWNDLCQPGGSKRMSS
ncbi:hypothetical protein EHZ77_15975 [Aeromonas dhakensis]|nr:hypothetical protein DYE42_11725 [Aeromonas dhakensis]RQM82312.1 hypothetical protein EHZ77_15975 [Aeromonas dhakensis]